MPALAYHSIFGFYGFWLPNDPRGSGSDYVASLVLLKFGKATKVHSRRSVAGNAHDHAQRLAAKQALKYARLKITGSQALAVANGFKQAISETGYALYACAIMPDHVHLVIQRHVRSIRQIIGHLKARATSAIRSETRLQGGRPIWGAHGWNIFLTSDEDVRRAIRYVQANPTKDNRPRQHWSFVREFTGVHAIPFHPLRFALKSGD